MSTWIFLCTVCVCECFCINLNVWINNGFYVDFVFGGAMFYDFENWWFLDFTSRTHKNLILYKIIDFMYCWKGDGGLNCFMLGISGQWMSAIFTNRYQKIVQRTFNTKYMPPNMIRLPRHRIIWYFIKLIYVAIRLIFSEI